MTGPGRGLAQADLLLLLARMLDRDAGPDVASAVGDAAARRAVARTAFPDSATAFGDMLDAIADELAAGDEIRAREHTRLFAGAAACPADEAAYVRRDKGAIIGDVCGFYRAFGFAPSGGTGERPDHVVTELEFAALLLVLEAGAREDGSLEHASIAREALTSFLRDHLLDWVPSFAQRLADVTRLPLFAATAGLLDRAVRELGAERGLEGIGGDVAAEIDDGTPYECDLAADEAFVPLTGLGAESPT